MCTNLEKNVYLVILVFFMTCITMVILFSIFCLELVCVSAILCCSHFRNKCRAFSGYPGPQPPQYTMNAMNTGTGMEGGSVQQASAPMEKQYISTRPTLMFCSEAGNLVKVSVANYLMMTDVDKCLFLYYYFFMDIRFKHYNCKCSPYFYS